LGDLAFSTAQSLPVAATEVRVYGCGVSDAEGKGGPNGWVGFDYSPRKALTSQVAFRLLPIPAPAMSSAAPMTVLGSKYEPGGMESE